MGQHRRHFAWFCACLSIVALAVVGLRSNFVLAANEILNVILYPTTSNPTPYGANVTFGVQVQETSGQPDTVQMNYSAVDANNNSLTCSPAQDDVSVSKGHPANDSCTVDTTGAALPYTFTAYAVGQTGGASYTFTMTTNLN